MTIESPHNAKLKEVRRLQRRRGRERAGRFVAEGEDLTAAAREAGWTALEMLVAAGSGLPGTEVAPEALAAVSELASGSRALGVYEERWSEPAGPLAVYLHGVRDPGNVGTILRSAHAFGAASVILGPGCADPYGPKAVRSSMGAIFHVPLARADGPRSLPGRTVALAARAGRPLPGLGPSGELTLLVGAERDGLPAEVLAAADEVRHIQIEAAESLNAAMAATIALYELRRSDPAPSSRVPAA